MHTRPSAQSWIALGTALLVSLLCTNKATAQPQKGAPSDEAARVTVDNFVRAETDNYFARFVNEGGFGKFKHDRAPADIDHQTIIRLNRDTLYSFGVFDLDASPVTITLPDGGKRFMALMVVNEDHYVPEVVYAPGPRTFTKEQVGTRYVCMAVRTFANPGDPADLQAAATLQDSIKVEQKAVGAFDAPKWDQTSLKKVRDALLGLTTANGSMNSSRMFGRKDKVDPVQHLMGTAAGWGGNPAADAFYTGADPKENDGKTSYTLTLKDVPVDGFWSVSVYNKDGYFEKNAQDSYSINNVTAARNNDGSVTIHCGGDANAPNFIPITPGWNYLLRMYRPRQQILDGTWKAPVAVAVAPNAPVITFRFRWVCESDHTVKQCGPYVATRKGAEQGAKAHDKAAHKGVPTASIEVSETP